MQLLTEPDNVAMRCSALTAGFGDEGLLRSYLKEHGQRVDVTMLSLVADDVLGRS